MPVLKINILFFILSSLGLHAQSNHITLKGNPYKQIQKSAIQKSYILDIERSQFKSKHQKTISDQMITLDLILGDQRFYLDLFEDDIIASSLVAKMMEKGLNVPITYEGYTSKGGRTRITINEGYIYGYIEEENVTYYIEPASYNNEGTQSNAFIIYDGEAAMVLNSLAEDHMCGYVKPVIKSINDKIGNVPKKSFLACRGLRMAIASDHTMWNLYGGENGVNNHNIGVLNNVQGDYDGSGSGAFDIEFQVIAQYNSSSVANNPYTSTGADASTILGQFNSWSVGGGFGAGATSFLQGSSAASALAVLWTDVNISAPDQNGNPSFGVVGLAYTPGNHSLLEDFGGSNPAGSGFGLRVLQSHEMGHNLGYGHDDSASCSGGNCIMWPSVQNTSTWSSASITAINSNLNGRTLTGCIASCTNGIQDLGELGIDCGGACSPCPCTANDTYLSPLNLTIQLDNYAEESSWNIMSANGTVLYNASYAVADRGTSKTINNLSLSQANGIIFSFTDSYGDGICCSFGSGSFTLKDANNQTIVTGGTFTAVVSAVFCIGSNTCSNGVQDVGEQGIDCGGNCTPCITGCMTTTAHNYNANAQVDDGSCQTCNDGIKNGDEVVTDCGGSKCTPCITGCMTTTAHNYNANAQVDDGSCQTCTDGIKNGDEVVTDCGGSKCTPCITGCITTTAHNYNANAQVDDGSCPTCNDGIK
ncbi:MAG: M12 family metallo-peptidase, partial [Saprospiraceae bacterium]